MHDPVFLLSSERSGSNLLRVMMDSHPEFSAPHSPHLIKTFVPMLAQYGPLSNEQHRRSLATDMLRVIEVQLRGWAYTPTLEEVIAHGDGDSFRDVFLAIYGIAAAKEGKQRSFIKDNGAIPHAAELTLLFPNARFVYLVRDARDMALSWKRSPGHPGGVASAARMWSLEQNAALRFLSMVADRGSVCLLHYEDLVQHPRVQLQRLSDFLDASFDEQMLKFFAGSEAKTSAEAAVGWENLVKPVMQDNCGKYRTQLSGRERKAIERIAGRPLIQLGYRLDFPRQPSAQEADFWGKLTRAGRTALTQLLRGPAGIQELKQRTHRLRGLREIMRRVSRQSPTWDGSRSADDAPRDEESR